MSCQACIPLPDEVRDLGTVMQLKVLMRRLGGLGLELFARRLKLHLSDATPLEPETLLDRVQASGGSTKLTSQMQLVHTLDADVENRLEAVRGFLESLISPTSRAST